MKIYKNKTSVCICFAVTHYRHSCTPAVKVALLLRYVSVILRFMCYWYDLVGCFGSLGMLHIFFHIH